MTVMKVATGMAGLSAIVSRFAAIVIGALIMLAAPRILCSRSLSQQVHQYLPTTASFDAVINNSRQHGDGQQLEAFAPRKYPSCECKQRPGHDCEFLVSRKKLHKQPTFLESRAPSCILRDEWIKPYRLPMFSVILTVYNQEVLVQKVVEAVLNTTTELYELVVVFDGCIDNSINLTTALLDAAVQEQSLPSNLVHVLLIEQPTPVWETSANNIGMRAATPGVQFFVLLQDDMQMIWHGWNTLLAFPARLYSDDVLSVSGRCAHSHYSQPSKTNLSSHVGRCGANIDAPLVASNQTRCTFHVRDTSNRGPLLLNSTRMAELGYFDEVNYYLGNDDHDLHKRAWREKKWVTGWMPLDFIAKLVFGATRGRKSKPSPQQAKLQQQYLAARKSRITKDPSTPKGPSHDEDRPMPSFAACLKYKHWYINATQHWLDMNPTAVLQDGQ